MKVCKNFSFFVIIFVLMNVLMVSAEPTIIKYQTDENYPPYAYKQGDELLGFDFELAKMIFSDGPYEVEYSADIFDNAYNRLVKGETDSAGIIAVREERKKDILYSDTVLKSYIGVFTREDGPNIKIEELKNYKVGVGRGFYTEQVLKEKAGVSYYYAYDNVEAALEDLEKRRIDAVFGNQETINFLIVKKGFKNNIIPRIPNIYPFDLAIGINKRNPQLVNFINERLKLLKKNGTFELLHQKYFSSYSPEYYKKQKDSLILAITAVIALFIAIVMFLRMYIRDLEKRIRRDNKEIMLQKAYFRQLFENSPQATVILDLDDNIIDVNTGFEKLYGYEAEKIKGEKLSPLIMPEGMENEGVSVNSLILTGKFYQQEGKRKRKDGSLVDVSILGYPIIHEEQNIGVYGIYTDISERKQQEQIIKYYAYYDSLTELPNRHHFMEKLEIAINEAKEKNKVIAMLFIDLDKFKSINDSFGHNVGDKLLLAVGCRLNNIIREGDMVARMGGDEFIIMLKQIDSTDVVYRIVERIHESLNKAYIIEGNEMNITASIGISFYPKDGKDAETLLKNSDIAMYMAKIQGRNNYQLYSENLK